MYRVTVRRKRKTFVKVYKSLGAIKNLYEMEKALRHPLQVPKDGKYFEPSLVSFKVERLIVGSAINVKELFDGVN